MFFLFIFLVRYICLQQLTLRYGNYYFLYVNEPVCEEADGHRPAKIYQCSLGKAVHVQLW